MRVDIAPQWPKIVGWYWDSVMEEDNPEIIWDILKREHKARRVFSMSAAHLGMWMIFPNEEEYLMFLLRWS